MNNFPPCGNKDKTTVDCMPADAISCASCSIPLYCSDWCQIQAGAPKFDKSSNSFSGLEGLAADLKNYMSDVVLAGASTLDTGHIAEHRHECHGFHWPLILPSEVVLAGRILVKVIEQNRRASADSNLVGFLVNAQMFGFCFACLCFQDAFNWIADDWIL